MNIADSLKTELLVKFKSENKLKNSFKNYEIYKFSSLNSTQLLKFYSLSSQKIFTESNSKKHLQKIFEMIKLNFYSEQTENYLNLFFIPTNDENEIKKRREVILNCIDFDFESQNKILKTYISALKELNEKISFSRTIYTLEKSTQNYLYENYSLNIIAISRKDLEEMSTTNLENFILVTEENLNIENDVYSLGEFEDLIEGYIIKKNKEQILILIEIFKIISDKIQKISSSIEIITNKKQILNLNVNKLKESLEKDNSQILKELLKKANNLEIEVEKINIELKDKISSKKVSLEGNELLELLNSGNVGAIANKLKQETTQFISIKEKELIEEFKKNKFSLNYVFESHNYPLKIDSNVKEELISKIDARISSSEYESFEELGKFDLEQINLMQNIIYFFDLFYGISKFSKKYDLVFANIGRNYSLIDAKNIYIENPKEITYGLGINKIKEEKLNGEKISVLTGANSGGKTTLLEMFLQSQILTTIGFGISANKQSEIFLADEVIYLKKFTGTLGSGAFEQTIRNLIEILDSDTSKLILIDEFEAITEPGAAAKILIGFLEELSRQQNFAITVSHLGADIKEYIQKNNIASIRIDGISAIGLDEKGNLITNHQPKFNELGKSTPELILKRVLKDENFWKGKSEKTKKLLETILN